MAVKDVKRYYYTMLSQFLEMKADLADFEQAFADGFITEDQLEAAREDIAKLEANYDRLTYIMYLLEMPNRSSKKQAHEKRSKDELNYLSAKKADAKSVFDENKSALEHLRQELKRLSKVGD